jgi:lysophospholipase L1-like esterase
MVRFVLLLSAILFLGCRPSPASGLPTLERLQVDQQAGVTLDVPPEQGEPLRYLALGDSYTVGEAVQKSNRWPNQLASLLRDAGYEIEDPQIVARSGWTTDGLAAALQQAEIDPPYDLVSLLIGANNQFRDYSPESYRQELAALLEQSVAYAGNRPGRVLVLSIPDWSMTPVGSQFDRQTIAGEIDAFNWVIKQEAERQGVRFIDITPVSRNAESDPDLVAIDGLHPSGKMYAQWAALAVKETVLALKE